MSGLAGLIKYRFLHVTAHPLNRTRKRVTYGIGKPLLLAELANCSLSGCDAYLPAAFLLRCSTECTMSNHWGVRARVREPPANQAT